VFFPPSAAPVVTIDNKITHLSALPVLTHHHQHHHQHIIIIIIAVNSAITHTTGQQIMADSTHTMYDP